MKLRIREYEDSDIGSCRDLWRELTQRHREIYSDPSIGGDDPGGHFDVHLRREDLAGIWVAVDGSDNVVGMAGLLVRGAEAEIEPVVVMTGCRSQGVGTWLIEWLTTEARTRGAKHLSIRPVARNVEAITCFHRAGFRLLGQIDMFIDLSGRDDERWKPAVEIHGHVFRY